MTKKLEINKTENGWLATTFVPLPVAQEKQPNGISSGTNMYPPPAFIPGKHFAFESDESLLFWLKNKLKES